MSVVFTQAELDALKAAYVSGVLTVTIGDRTVTYRSQKDLLSAITQIEKQLNPSTANASVIKATYSRGGS